jgi:hypothetical protein
VKTEVASHYKNLLDENLEKEYSREGLIVERRKLRFYVSTSL